MGLGGRFLRTVLWGLATYSTATQGAPILRTSNPSAFVTAHNVLRCMHGLPPVTWSSTLAASAQAWASVCNGASTPISVRLQLNIGENTASTTGGLPRPQDVVNVWYDMEINQYDWSTLILQPGTGHLTQILWKSTTQIGCARCEQGDGSNWKWTVCQYSPPGNGPYVQDNLLPPIRSRQECIGCVDNPVGWVDSYNYACSQYDSLNLCYPDGTYAEGWSPGWGPFSRYANNGKDATQACCVCGGGVRAATTTTTAAAGGNSKCADEGGTCSCSGSVQYGVADAWTSPRAVTGQVACTNGVFGDPSPGKVKSCKCLLASPSPSPWPPTSSSSVLGYSKCADEGGTCSCTGSVKYGVGDVWTAPRDIAGQISCNNNQFGDPKPGKVKACYCQPASVTATAAAANDNSSSLRPTYSAEPTSNVWPWLALPFGLLALGAALGALFYCYRRHQTQQRAEAFLDPEGFGRGTAAPPRPAPVSACACPTPNPVPLPDDGTLPPIACQSPALPRPPPGSPVAGPPAK